MREDKQYEEAVRLVRIDKMGSVSLLQRKLGVSYKRGEELLNRMERDGIVGPFRGARPREYLGGK